MNKNLQTVFHYHETTKHAPQRYARSLGYMDWETQANPFREYEGALNIPLELSFENKTLPYHLLDTYELPAPVCESSISQFLQFSMGIAAWKESGDTSWAVRCNASSGNLHPTETYLILSPSIYDHYEHKKETESSVCHYNVKNHSLEYLASFETDFWEQLRGHSMRDISFVVALSSISWREVWKYGERAFRYVNLDAGHAWQSLVVSAKMLGWRITRVDSLSSEEMAKILGLEQTARFSESEIPDMLLIVSEITQDEKIDFSPLLKSLPKTYEGVANKLSKSMYEWDIIPAIEQATITQEIPQSHALEVQLEKKPSQESKDVVLQRRSVHVMDKEKSRITQEQFHILLQSISHSLDYKENASHLVLFIHRVEGYEEGLYILIRNHKDKTDLENVMHKNFLWEETAFDNLYLLEQRNLNMQSKSISCSQDIASDGAFSLGMLCRFSEELIEFGAHRYKELFWECGAIGQQLYLEATSLGLSGTGIGCFLDDTMHGLLGLKDNKFQVLYHFTVGRGFVDSRIVTKPAYPKKELFNLFDD